MCNAKGGLGLQDLMESELIVLKTSDKRSARKSSLQFSWLLFTTADIIFGVGGDKQIFFIETLSGGGDSLCPMPLRPLGLTPHPTVLIFFGVCLTLYFDYMCSEADFIQ